LRAWSTPASYPHLLAMRTLPIPTPCPTAAQYFAMFRTKKVSRTS
jgi:hypothetical protein